MFCCNDSDQVVAQKVTDNEKDKADLRRQFGGRSQTKYIFFTPSTYPAISILAWHVN